jgi:hypothetical protein
MPARMMGTHAIKTELLTLLRELRPEKTWHRKPKLAEMADFAVHNLDPESTDPKVGRARELARLIYKHERR